MTASRARTACPWCSRTRSTGTRSSTCSAPSPTARSRRSSGSPRTASWRRRLEDKVEIAGMASLQFSRVGPLHDRIRELGADPFAAMAPFREALDLFHEHTAPADWYESLIKAYVGDGLADDFYREIAAYLDADTRDLIVASRRRRRLVGVRRRPGARRHRRRPPARRPAGAVGPPADGGGAHPGAAGGGRAGRAHGAARRRRRPARARPGRDRPDVHPAHRAARRADGRARALA